MKIAMIGHKRIPSREGGIEIVVEELSARLVRLGHQVHAYNRSGCHVSGFDVPTPRLKQYRGIRIITIPTPSSKSLNALVYSIFATLYGLFQGYDVMHYHAEGPCVMLFLPHLLHIRTVATIHGLDWQRNKWGGFASAYLKLGEKIAAAYADEVVVLSRNVQEYFRETYGRTVTYLPNGINPPEPREANIIRQKYGLEKNSYYLFLARIVPEKGVHYLIQAFQAANVHKKLVIAGGSSHSSQYFREMQDMAASDPRILFTGFVQGTELEELYSNCSCYILPSDVEGMPISLLEAMSYRRRCLVSNIPENLEAAGDAAITFERSDVASLTERLLSLSGMKNGMEDEGFCSYDLSAYDWNRITEQLAMLYQGQAI